jgi:hypothetical protein
MSINDQQLSLWLTKYIFMHHNNICGHSESHKQMNRNILNEFF